MTKFDSKKICPAIEVKPKIIKTLVLKSKVVQSNVKAGGSGNLRVKICLSDTRTDVMEFSSDITVTTFLSLLSQKFNIEVGSIHSIRSGHPPKVLDQANPQSVVHFQNLLMLLNKRFHQQRKLKLILMKKMLS